MDREDVRKSFSRDLESQDTYDTRQAKQRASIKWLLSKAYNNRVPENLREPFYRDHEDQEHLKPQIVHNLANAELYCLAFANIYSDPNYHNLNHCGILQTLSRKGITIPDPPDGPLTETVLIQTTPLKLGAHMAVIEATMVLYAKEVVTPDRVVAAIHRFTQRQEIPDLPQDAESGLLLWVNHSQKALTRRIQLELEREGQDKNQRIPTFPEVKDIKGLCDGAGLAALISFYCPEELPWTDIRIPCLPTVSDSVHNLCLVHEFSHHSLPHTVCHMMPEDVTYLRGNMKQNLLVLLADLFNVLEIHPVKCVRFPGSERNRDLGPARNCQGVVHKRSLPQAVTAIPDLRSNLATNSSFTVSRPVSNVTSGIKKYSSSQTESTFKGSPDSLEKTTSDRKNEEAFVVHRGKGVPTLSSVIVDDPVVPPRLRNKDRSNFESKVEETSKAAGKPSNWEDQKRSSFAGRRSRRNSLSEESQLTVENFGGSQENLHFLGRNPDKEPAIHISGRSDNSSAPLSPTPNVPLRTSAQETRSSGVELIFAESEALKSQKQQQQQQPRKSPSPAPIPFTPNVPVRSSQQDCRSNAIDRIFADNGYGIDKCEEEKFVKEENTISLKNMTHSKEGNEIQKDVIDGEILGTPSNFNDRNSAPEIFYRDNGSGDHINSQINPKSSLEANGNEKKTTFVVLPNTTTWQQQKPINSININNMHEVSSIPDETSSMQLHNIRLKLEEKRRVIENEKRRMEHLMSKQRQKVGKAAFLQAITKDKFKSPDSKLRTGSYTNGESIDCLSSKSKSQRPFALQDIKEDLLSIERKWLDGNSPYVEERKTPDFENLNFEQYQFSIAQMNSSLKELDADMQRLSTQQTKLHGYVEEFKHGQQQQMQNFSNQTQNYSSQTQNFSTQSQSYGSQNENHSNQMKFMNSRPMSTISNQISTQPSNYNTYTNFIPQSKPISLSQLTQANPSLPSQGQFFLHEQQPSQRRTWSQQHAEKTSWSQIDKNDKNVSQSFTLNENTRLQNGDTHSPQHTSKPQPPKPIVPARQLPPSSGPSYPASLPTPSADDMEPQSICFIGDGPDNDVDNISLGMSHINITSGSRTYRIPSPTRPSLIKSTLIQKSMQKNSDSEPIKENQPIEKGFYISFDDEAPPKRPKPPLRGKRSLKKERFATQTIEHPFEEKEKEDLSALPNRMETSLRTSASNFRDSVPNQIEYSPETNASLSHNRLDASPVVIKKREPVNRLDSTSPRELTSPSVGLIIGNEPDPLLIDEMERKKEKILMLSLQRRQQQEEMKARKEMEAAQRREIEKMKEEDKARKKEEEKARRAAILEQYKLKKAIEEAEREGKVIDKSELMKLNTPKLRSKTSTTSRPRPKTIHVESGGVEDGMLMSSRGKKGSSTNLAEQNRENNVFSRPLRRDQYRGSQDSLASSAGGRRGFRDSPSDDGRGSSPSRISSSNVGRRSSYKTSRDTSEPPSQVRGRTKYSTYQSNFRGRKSNSLMNLCGSSSDQDSMIYRYGDTDSGLGRATPPRRAPSPGITYGRHLTSPSGPGSLPPGLISKRKGFDDGSSDISSNASSMMEYTGPRLYKQPATKSNRGIMLNAVEYCVFPGAVNKEAKRRVLEEVSRSESKYFLILFRDAGCQFRALYSYCPDTEEVLKLYGTGPKQVNDKMFDKFFKRLKRFDFLKINDKEKLKPESSSVPLKPGESTHSIMLPMKNCTVYYMKLKHAQHSPLVHSKYQYLPVYNSGGKCFSQVHTKHLTVTIDAFTIHNSLWQGKKVNLPSKKDMALVI